MEGLGEKFQKARQARNLTLEEAARMTKIRPSKLAEIEAEEFTNFPSLAYAKGFVLIYGKFLNVDVSPYLEGFETPEQVTVDGYSYLQDNPAPAPRRVDVLPKRAASSGNKSSLMPLVIGIVVLVAGFSILKFMMDVRRLKPSGTNTQSVAQATPAPSIAAPRALAVDGTPPAPTIAAGPNAEPTAALAETTASPVPAVAAALPPSDEEPEVRRAEPVGPEDLLAATTAETPLPGMNRFDIRPLKKTFVRVVVDQAGGPSLERWLNVSEGPVQFLGKRIAIKVLDPAAVEIRKNGKPIGRGDADVRLE
jgi:cytoskeletal protein RodZ